MSIFVTPGGVFDCQAFSESTRKTLALLSPLVDLEHSQARDISYQAREFRRAYRLAVEAVQYGFTAIEDILTLTEHMVSTTLDERRGYLQQTLELADNAYSKAQEAFQVFREVRTNIFDLTNSYYTVPTPNVFARFITWPRLTFSRNHALRRSIEDLRGSIRVFEELENEIYALVQLWGWANIEPQVKRSGIVFDDSSLRESSVVNEWTLLRDHFADYSNMIAQLEESYPKLLTQNSFHNPESSDDATHGATFCCAWLSR